MRAVLTNIVFFVVILASPAYAKNYKQPEPILIEAIFDNEKKYCQGKMDERSVIITALHCVFGEGASKANSYSVYVGYEITNMEISGKRYIIEPKDVIPQSNAVTYNFVDDTSLVGHDTAFLMSMELHGEMKSGNLPFEIVPYGNFVEEEPVFVSTPQDLITCSYLEGSAPFFADCRKKVKKGHSGSPAYQKNEDGSFRWVGLVSAVADLESGRKDITVLQYVHSEMFRESYVAAQETG